ncbi:hypothetical protein CANTEDRAFT_104213 [Yamadazyma tenuis ATCC 10573]|uniref:Sm domain-containing protein n=1 Tax=Candida tenuis (strain ATCC 10573 / BCRC 21748 / CBS 615 / JCM 9827 / NBRC 10315 / NRRL Y-1498 / VKM Y-70) TaxID=590646 RepID=G3B136_CANTC|nr:uncharacterized protein CANTEDRAFT_104213 [Yamadazyma tenuis ATCC 10573]EGV64869.1 hypothetical protein CANTEDRAFT_104213 [Yamadazyma tenuis ATCC 10573]
MTTIAPEKFIGSSLRVELSDNRVLDGVLTVVDPFGNLLMSNVYETNKSNRREVGLVSVPRATISKLYIDKRTYQSLK